MSGLEPSWFCQNVYPRITTGSALEGYTPRLPGEPLDGASDIHLHPALPRTARLNLVIGF
jgi:hypothetical protein